jgi:3-methyladenine DNA glycosylase AlkD
VAIDPGRVADGLEARLRALGTRERAEHERRYLKSDLEHLGATVWQIRREAKSFAREHPKLSHAELVALVEALWAKPVHERRMAAVLLLEAYPSLVTPADLPLLERLVREAKTWALAQIKPLKAGAPFDRFGRYADAMLEEKEFFIRKAIGWVLREAGKTCPDEVFEWLRTRVDRASSVTRREAVKYLNPEQRGVLNAHSPASRRTARA